MITNSVTSTNTLCRVVLFAKIVNQLGLQSSRVAGKVGKRVKYQELKRKKLKKKGGLVLMLLI